MQPRLEEGQHIMVAARGITPVLSFALDEAQLRKASLYVVFVKEIAVYYGAGPVRGRARWQDDRRRTPSFPDVKARIGTRHSGDPVYAVSDDPPPPFSILPPPSVLIILMIGTSHRLTLTNLLRGNVVTNIVEQLPDTIRLIIYG